MVALSFCSAVSPAAWMIAGSLLNLLLAKGQSAGDYDSLRHDRRSGLFTGQSFGGPSIESI